MNPRTAFGLIFGALFFGALLWAGKYFLYVDNKVAIASSILYKEKQDPSLKVNYEGLYDLD